MAIDNQKAFNITLTGSAVLMGVIFWQLFVFIINIGFIQNLASPGETMSTLIPFLLGVGSAAGLYYYTKSNEVVSRFGYEVVAEVRKVVFPTRKEVTGVTTGVLVFIFLVAIILFVFDWIFGLFIKLLVQ